MYKLCFCLLLLATARTQAQPQHPLPWNYPCKPGTDCWNALTNVGERLSACQIKGIDLASVSTEDLLRVVMEHPLFRSYVFSDSPLEGLYAVLNDFNGFQEFRMRPDAMKTLVALYRDEDFNQVAAFTDSIQIGNYTLNWTGVELLLTNQELLSQLSANERLECLKVIHQKLVLKGSLRQFFGGTSVAATALIYHRLAKSSGHQIPHDIRDAEALQLLETKLIVTDQELVKSILADFSRFIAD